MNSTNKDVDGLHLRQPTLFYSSRNGNWYWRRTNIFLSFLSSIRLSLFALLLLGECSNECCNLQASPSLKPAFHFIRNNCSVRFHGVSVSAKIPFIGKITQLPDISNSNGEVSLLRGVPKGQTIYTIQESLQSKPCRPSAQQNRIEQNRIE